MDASKAFAIGANDNSTGRTRVLFSYSNILRGRHHPLEMMTMVNGLKEAMGCDNYLVRGRLQLTTPLLLRGYFFLTSRFESSEAMKVLGILSPKSRDALSDSLSNEKFKSSTRHQWPIRKF
jgi:hypothetical protein